MITETWAIWPRQCGLYWVANESCNEPSIIEVVQREGHAIMFRKIGDFRIGRLIFADCNFLFQEIKRPVTPGRLDRRLASLQSA